MEILWQISLLIVRDFMEEANCQTISIKSITLYCFHTVHIISTCYLENVIFPVYINGCIPRTRVNNTNLANFGKMKEITKAIFTLYWIGLLNINFDVGFSDC